MSWKSPVTKYVARILNLGARAVKYVKNMCVFQDKSDLFSQYADFCSWIMRMPMRIVYVLILFK